VATSLNRYFPGRPFGSAASRIAHRIFDSVIRRCDALVDIHTGSFNRSNAHQLRADLREPGVVDLARRLRSQVVVHKVGGIGTLRGAAVAAGIPAVTIEGGEPLRLSHGEVDSGVTSILRLMVSMGMSPESEDGKSPASDEPPQEFYYRSHWVRSPNGGILVTSARLGQKIAAGEVLGTVTDPLSDPHSSKLGTLQSLYDGRVIGIAFDQLVMPGFATIHIGVAGVSPRDIFVPGLPIEEEVVESPDGVELEERPE
jgi:predicted deacylase